ncbi:unnamed protein product, partial [Owenia fusiformis]
YVKCMTAPARNTEPKTINLFSLAIVVEMAPSDTYGIKIEADGLFGLDNLQFQCDENQHQCVASECPTHHTKLGSRCSIVDNVIVQVILVCMLNYNSSYTDKIYKDNNNNNKNNVLKGIIEENFNPVGYIYKEYSHWDSFISTYKEKFKFNITAPSDVMVASLEMGLLKQRDSLIAQLEQFYTKVSVDMTYEVIKLGSNDMITQAVASDQNHLQACWVILVTFLTFRVIFV